MIPAGVSVKEDEREIKGVPVYVFVVGIDVKGLVSNSCGYLMLFGR